MRFHDLTLHTPDGEARLDFHREMTVVAGLSDDERADLADRVVGAIVGQGTDSVLRYLSFDGAQRVLTTRNGVQRHHVLRDEADLAAPLVGSVFDDEHHLRRLTLIGPDRLAAPRVEKAPPALLDAREGLAALEDELEAARRDADDIPARRLALTKAEELANTATERRAQAAWREARRRVDDLRAELERNDEPELVRRDERVQAAADELTDAMTAWREQAALVDDLRERTTGLGPAEVRHDRDLPGELPDDLDELIERLDELRGLEDERRQQVRRLAADGLPEPSDPVVAELARHDQDELWTAHVGLTGATQRVEETRRRLAGLSGGDAAAVHLLEEAHRRLVSAEDRADRHFLAATGGAALAMIASMAASAASLPLALALFAVGVTVVVLLIVRPRLEAKSAALAEAAAAQRTGASTYLGFHLRRLEASLDRDLSGRLEAAQLELRLAHQEWVELTGGIDPELVGGFEHEVRSYAEAIDRLSDKADALQQAVDLAAETEERRREVESTLLARCEVHGIDDPPLHDAELLRRLFEHQVERRHRADDVHERCDAEADLGDIARRIAGVVSGLGLFVLDPDDLDAGALSRVEGLLADADARVRARLAGRDPVEIEADLDAAVHDAERLWDDGWDPVEVERGPIDEPLSDDEIAAAIAAAADELADVEARAAEVDRLTARHDALRRRVGKLEASLGSGRRSQDAAVLEDAEAQLQALFTAAGALGPMRERLPLVFDEAFVDAAAARKWDLLEMLRRLAEHNQVVYLTDDPYVRAWAHGACNEGRVGLIVASDDDATRDEVSFDDAVAAPREQRIGTSVSA